MKKSSTAVSLPQTSSRSHFHLTKAQWYVWNKKLKGNACTSPPGQRSLWWGGSSQKRLWGKRDVVDRGQNHKCGMSHGQTELIYDWSGSTSAAWCWGSRMSGMGVRSGSRFSLSIISGTGSRLCPARGIYEAFHCYGGAVLIMTVSGDTVRWDWSWSRIRWI